MWGTCISLIRPSRYNSSRHTGGEFMFVVPVRTPPLSPPPPSPNRDFCARDHFRTTLQIPFMFGRIYGPDLYYLIRFWLIFVMTLTLNCQGQIWNWIYLGQEWSDCHETNRKRMGLTPGLKRDHWVWSWPWPWIFKVKLRGMWVGDSWQWPWYFGDQGKV